MRDAPESRCLSALCLGGSRNGHAVLLVGRLSHRLPRAADQSYSRAMPAATAGDALLSQHRGVKVTIIDPSEQVRAFAIQKHPLRAKLAILRGLAEVAGLEFGTDGAAPKH